jgi:uncharacterized protein (TIGR03382 family)
MWAILAGLVGAHACSAIEIWTLSSAHADHACLVIDNDGTPKLTNLCFDGVLEGPFPGTPQDGLDLTAPFLTVDVAVGDTVLLQSGVGPEGFWRLYDPTGDKADRFVFGRHTMSWADCGSFDDEPEGCNHGAPPSWAWLLFLLGLRRRR